MVHENFRRVLVVSMIGAVGALWVVFNDPTYSYVGVAYLVALLVALNLLYFKYT